MTVASAGASTTSASGVLAIGQLIGSVWVAGIQAYAEMYRKPAIPASWPHPQEWLELPQRTQGEPIPVVFGTVWIREPHVFWVRDLHTQSMQVSTGSSGTGFWSSDTEVSFGLKRRFCTGLGMVLCQGPLDSIARIDVADQLLVGGNSPVVDGPVMTLNLGPEEIEVWEPNIFAAGPGSGEEVRYDDGVAGRLGVAPGLEDQSGLVIPRWGTERGNLRGVSTVWFRGPGSDFDWSTYDDVLAGNHLKLRDKQGSVYEHPYAFYFGASPALRPWGFLATRCLGRNGGINQWNPTKAFVDTYYDVSGARVYDMNPAHVFVELLCDPFWGLDLGDPTDVIDATSFEAMADIWAAGGTGIGLSWVWDREAVLVDVVRQIERIGDVVLEHEPTDNKWHLRSWQSAVTPVDIGDSDIVDINISVPSPDELPTTIHVTWQDRRRGREQTYILQDLAAIYERGREIVHTWNAAMIASPVTVPVLARRELARMTTPAIMVDVELLRTDAIAALRITDPVTLTSTEHGLSGQFRVAEWDHGVRSDGTVRLTLIGEPTADDSTPIWHEPDDPTEVTPEALPELTFVVEEMPLHVWWSRESGIDNLPERLWAEGSDIDQITRLWMWALRPTDRWDLDGWRWADRLIDSAGSPEGYITISPEVSPFSGSFEVTTLDRGNDRVGTDELEHDGTRVLQVGDILAVPHTDETPILSLDSTGLSLPDRGGLASRNLDYGQMNNAFEFLIVTEVVDSTHVNVIGGLWDTLPAKSIGGTSLVVGHYPIISPWDCLPDELRFGGAGQVRRAPPSIGSPLAVRDAVQTAALAVAGGRVKAFDDITPLDVPLSGADAPAPDVQRALTRPIRPLVGGAIELFEIEDGANSRIAITVEPRTRDSRFWAPSGLSLTNITEGTQNECCVWPDDPPPLILWIIDPSSGDVIATRPWTTSYSSGELAFLNSDEEAIHDAIHGGSQLFSELTLIVTADAALIEAPPGTLKSIQSWQYLRFDIERAPAAPGDTITDINSGTPVQYFGVDGDDDLDTDISFAVGRGVTGGWVIGVDRGNSTDPHIKRIPDTLGAEVWQYDGANTNATARNTAGFEVDEGELWATTCGDGTVGTNGRQVLVRIDMDDGATIAQYVLDHGGDDAQALPRCLSIDRVNNEVYVGIGAGGDEVKRHTIDSGTVSTSGNDVSLGSIAGMCVSPDGTDLVALGVGPNCYIGKWSLPLTGTGTDIDTGASGRTQCDGTDTANNFAYFAGGDNGARVVPARDGSNKVWFSPGYFGTTTDQPWAGRYNPDEADPADRVDLEISPIADSSLTPGTYNKTISMDVDKYGYVYFLCANGPQETDEYDIVRYTPDGVFDLSFAAQPGVTMPGGGGWSYGIPLTIAVNDDDKVILTTEDGYVMGWTQT